MNQVVNLKKPPRVGTKGAPPTETELAPNTHKPASGAKEQLCIQVPANVRRAFRIYAMENDFKEMGDLFQVMWDEYRARHG